MNSIRKCLLLFTLLCFVFYVSAQIETASNSEDDDNDRLVDIFDPDITTNVGSEYFYFGQPVPTCREKPPVLDSYTLELKYKTDETTYPIDQRCGVFVGDLDGDGVPELVGKDGGSTQSIRVFNGIDGSHLVSYSMRTNTYSQVAIANIGTKDSYKGCIFVVDNSSYLRRLDFTKTDNGDGTFSYSLVPFTLTPSGVKVDGNAKSPQLADFDMDGTPEVYVGNYIYDSNTLVRKVGDNTMNSGENNVDDAWPIAYDVFASGDLKPDGSGTFGNEADGLELIAGNKIYTVDLATNSLDEAIAVDIDGYTLSLRKEEASLVEVQIG